MECMALGDRYFSMPREGSDEPPHLGKLLRIFAGFVELANHLSLIQVNRLTGCLKQYRPEIMVGPYTQRYIFLQAELALSCHMLDIFCSKKGSF